MTLLDMPPQSAAKIIELKGNEEQVTRLYELGFYTGLEIKLERRLAFGGPFIVYLGPGFVALREEEARCLIVK